MTAAYRTRSALRIVAVLLCALGWWISLDLLRLTGGASATNPLIALTCGGDDDSQAAFDCDGVLASRYGAIPLSRQPGGPKLPAAALGMAWFAGLLLWFAFVGESRGRWVWHVVLLIAMTASCLRSLALTWVMAFELHAWCSGCAAAHAINGLLFILAMLLAPWRRSTDDPPHPSHPLALATLTGGFTTGLLHLAVVLLMIFAQARADAQRKYLDVVGDPNFICWDVQRQPRAAVASAEADWAGEPNAPHEVVVFTDMQCAACKRAHALLNELLVAHPRTLRVTYRHFPQNEGCNPCYRGAPHAAACDAARAVEAARQVGGATAGRRMRDLLFERQTQFADAPLEELAQEIGLDSAAFSAALSDPAAAARIRTDAEAAAAAGVRYPPGIFLDGRRVRYWNQPSAWRRLLGVAQSR